MKFPRLPGNPVFYVTVATVIGSGLVAFNVLLPDEATQLAGFVGQVATGLIGIATIVAGVVARFKNNIK